MINWKLRLQNKTTLVALIGFVVAFVYQILGLFGITAPITQDQIMSVVGIVITLLVGMGVVVDPTTSGISDSERALGYNEPFSTSDVEVSEE